MSHAPRTTAAFLIFFAWNNAFASPTLPGADFAAVWTWADTSRGLLFGMSIAGGDFDGDGFADIAVGSPLSPPSSEGRVLIWRGSPSGPEGKHTELFGVGGGGGGFYNYMGTSIASCDINADGFDDLVVGAPGRVEVYYLLGSPGGLGSIQEPLNEPRR